MDLLASSNYTKQNKMLESFIIFITQEKYCIEENKIHKSTKLTKKKIFVGLFCRRNWYLLVNDARPRCYRYLLAPERWDEQGRFFWVSSITRAHHQTKRKQSKLQTVDYKKQLVIMLYYLKNTCYLWMTANTFGVHQCTISKTLSEVYKVINRTLGPKYLYLQRNAEEMREIVSKIVI